MAVSLLLILNSFTLMSTFVDCQIISSPSAKTVCVGDNVDLDWQYGDAANFFTVTWTFIDSQSSAQTTIMQQVAGQQAMVNGGYNVVHKTNGGITLTGVTKANSGSFKIGVTYSSATSPVDDTVAVTVNDCSSGSPAPICDCDVDCETLVILSIVFGSLGIGHLIFILVGACTGLCAEIFILVTGVIGIFIADITCLGLSARVVDNDCCKECEDWIPNSAIAFVVISCVDTVAKVVILLLVKFGVINGGNDELGNVVGTGSGKAKSDNSNSQPARSKFSSDRAKSDGEVSRKDVTVQENEEKLHRRPMPPIPPKSEHQDNKGRDSSANNDHHQMIIPEKKAGQLMPLEEEPKKKKKKKKKADEIDF